MSTTTTGPTGQRPTRSTDAPCGTSVLHAGERFISRGSPAPGKLTIERAGNRAAWRVVPVHEVTVGWVE